MKYLFLFTITPVQDFISQSRKLKDLFGSSEILSYMSEIGMKICKREKGEIIFPFYNEKSRQKSYPNRFLVEFNKKNEEELKSIGKEIEENLLKYLRGLNNLNHLKIKEHLEEYFTFYWAFSEIESDYKSAFDNVEKLLAGAKNRRFFNQLGSGEGEFGRKCSICGERNVAVYNGKLSMPKEQLKKDKPKRNKIAQKDEGLCGVCYAKRANSSQKFDSTAEVALMHIFNKVKRENYSNLEDEAQLFFEENLTKHYFEKNNIYINLKDCKDDFEKFKNDLKKHKLKQTSYYAVVMFDGDSMGEWLSGNSINKDNLLGFHKTLSKKLGDFAQEANKILNNPKGLTVYAGGEDFLGFININHLFEILQELREEWNKIVANPLQQEFETKEKLTFSAGVVVAHYKTPLYEVLKKTRVAEKRAKEYDSKKDKICFVALKRSGEIRETVVPYSHLSHLQNILKELKVNFSDGFISVLEREFDLMVKANGLLDIDKRVSILVTEIKRLLNRAQKIQTIKSEKVNKFTEEEIKPLITKNFTNFVNTLNIIRFLKRETNDNTN